MRVSGLGWKLCTFLQWKLRQFHAGTVRRILELNGCQDFELTDKPALVIAPHPDDETIGCGGLIALKRQRGSRVVLVVLSDGRNSCDLGRPVTAAEAAWVRRNELIAASTILGLAQADVHFLNLPDSELLDLPPDTKHSIADALARIMSSSEATEVYVPHRLDGHQDHEAAYDLATRAATLSPVPPQIVEYPVWRDWSTVRWTRRRLTELRRTRRLPIHSVHGLKKHAMRAYRSQREALPSGFLSLFDRPFEFFLRDDSVIR